MHPLQRQWDALLILHWRRDNKMGALAHQCKELLGKYPSELAEEGALRCKGYQPHYMHVRVWVDSYLYPLNAKLWDVEDNKRVLDWLNASTGLDCVESKKSRKWQREGYDQAKRSSLHERQWSLSRDIEKSANRLNAPNQVKATGRGGKTGRVR